MAHGTAFWTAQTPFLDEDFDAHDAVADYDLCRAIAAGRMGLHPDAWGAHDPLSARPPRIRARRSRYERVYHPSPADLKAAKHWPRPVEEPKPKPKPKPAWHPHTPEALSPAHGTLQLTCDVCNRHQFGMMLEYRGDRLAKVAEIRALGHEHGWTRIAGTDRCPACSQAATPKPIGNGAGGNQGDEQHA